MQSYADALSAKGYRSFGFDTDVEMDMDPGMGLGIRRIEKRKGAIHLMNHAT
ncbi:GH17836 [Drosophila grimshawi]|uniref:GH17836 n=1 Tax=Drosophila grimshawi TaxID=7222 RepID=B4JWX1_DROGR|nr:GH17836 [Drosophila grimshawi]